MVNGKWVSSLEEVKGEALRFLKGKFTESLISRSKLIIPFLKSISMMEAIKLEAPFTLEEIKIRVWICGSDKAPGPNAFTIKFIKAYWDTFEDDVMNYVLHFDKFGTLAWGSNSSFITLVPKMDFVSKWHLWIKGCLNSSHISVIINMSSTNEFKISKGVRQGDPLSPILFIISMESLNVVLKAIGDKGLFIVVKIPNGALSSHTCSM
uniref:Reverse transcriptase domain-containing protein n=1 Tax=Lactuca sativa TaxID=4236 RepID=A0A9R1USX4_LACSA|nr:hypothetical protein LSAT_V11C800443040 [Lactuca sativa]